MRTGVRGWGHAENGRQGGWRCMLRPSPAPGQTGAGKRKCRERALQLLRRQKGSSFSWVILAVQPDSTPTHSSKPRPRHAPLLDAWLAERVPAAQGDGEALPAAVLLCAARGCRGRPSPLCPAAAAAAAGCAAAAAAGTAALAQAAHRGLPCRAHAGKLLIRVDAAGVQQGGGRAGLLIQAPSWGSRGGGGRLITVRPLGTLVLAAAVAAAARLRGEVLQADGAGLRAAPGVGPQVLLLLVRRGEGGGKACHM